MVHQLTFGTAEIMLSICSCENGSRDKLTSVIVVELVRFKKPFTVSNRHPSIRNASADQLEALNGRDTRKSLEAVVCHLAAIGQ